MPDQLTTAEMRCVHATLCANCEHAEKVGALTTLVFAFQLRPILDLAEAELASREREEREAANGNVKCARCGYLGRRHFELDCFDHEFVPGSEAIGQAGTPLRAEECVLPPPSKGEPTFEERYGPWICCGCGLAHKS